MEGFDFSDVWAYAFSYKSRSFLYDLEWDGRAVEGSLDIILVGRVKEHGNVIEIKDSKIFEIDDFKIFSAIYGGRNSDLVKELYEMSNPELFKNRKFKLEDVFGKVCFDERVERVEI